MKLSARRKYDYRELDKIEAKHNSYASDMLFGEIAANWAIRSLKERALTRHLRAFGRRRGNVARNGPKKELCDLSNIWDWEPVKLIEWHREKAGTIEGVHDVLKNEVAGCCRRNTLGSTPLGCGWR